MAKSVISVKPDASNRPRKKLKRSQLESTTNDVEEILHRKLQAHGEEFMRMFDDYDSAEEAQVEGQANEEGLGGAPPGYPAEEEGDGSSGASGKASEKDEASEEEDEEGEQREQVMEVYYGSSITPGQRAKRKDWSTFMSPRAADVHRVRTESPAQKPEEEGEGGPSHKELFASISKEVEKLGASQLNEKERRKWEANRLAALGAKPAKSPKRSPVIGLGIKRKAEKREEVQREQDIAAGMVRIKGTGIAKRRAKSAEKKRRPEERGLQASDGTFRNGVLYVQPSKIAKHGLGGSKRRGGGMQDSDLGGTGGRKGGGQKPKKKSKGKGKKGKGKKRK